MATFDINDALKFYMSDPGSVPTPEADEALLDAEIEPDLLTNGLVSSVLHPIIDAVAETPDAIAQPETFDTVQQLLKFAPVLPLHALSKLFDLITSGLAAESDAVHHDLDDDEQDVASHKVLLEMYAFLLQWTIAAVETRAAEKTSAAPARRRMGKAAKAKAAEGDDSWDSSVQLQAALDTMCRVLRLKLGRIFLTTSERDTFIGLLTRPVYLVLESEPRTKSTPIRMHAFKVLCMAVKHHGHAYAAQISIVQNLTYFEHLSEPMAEFLHILAEQYDYEQLASEILVELSNREFSSNDTRGPKSVSAFVVKLSELAPRVVIKQVAQLIKQMDSESYTLRCVLIEICGNMIAFLSRSEERGDDHKSQLNAFFSVLEERFLDINPYCRSRTMQVYVKLCDLDMKFPKRRLKAAELARQSLEDKSSNVRRNAIKLLGCLIKTHPFTAMHGAQLSRSEYQARLEAVEAEIDALQPPEGAGLGETDTGGGTTGLLDEATQMDQTTAETEGTTAETTQTPTPDEAMEAVRKAQEAAATSEAIAKLTLTKKYYTEALKFIHILGEATTTVCQLLSSRNKSEVIEAMDYFEIGDAYNIEQNKLGIRRMLRLIWTKGNSDEGKGVQTHLIECYRRLFFEAPDSFGSNDAANYIARNMISLTFGATPAELTSLEQLLATMVRNGAVADVVVAKLWQVYGVQKRAISRTQRRGAIIVLGMLATANPEIVVGEMETMLRTGLGAHGRADVHLAKYTCIALQRMNPASRGTKDTAHLAFTRLPNDHAVLRKLADVIDMGSESRAWFGVAEQAINAIYALSEHPDVLCTELIRRRTRAVFSPVDVVALDGLSPSPSPSPTQTQTQMPPMPSLAATNRLSQLLIVVGHVAIKQIVHLELCEHDFKRRKADHEKELAEAKAARAAEVKAARAAEREAARAARKGRGKNKAGESNEEQADESNADLDELDESNADLDDLDMAEAPADDLDMIGGTTEDDFTEAMQYIREHELLYGPTALLGMYGPLVSEICARNTTYRNRGLQSAATLCMAKLMCVSSEYCETNLPLLITIMERSRDPTVRSNVVIALGDMAVCFNHLIDENTDFLYRRLADEDVSVKRTCLMTLTFLILAGQVKVKGQLGEMAKCLEDDDKHIADLARMFFTELSTKDNAVYNHFVDMFSLLSAEDSLGEEPFRRIVKFLLGFVEKDRHARQLADKLSARLARCDSERQWNDVAYAIGLLPHKNEDIAKVLAEGFKVVTLEG